MVFVQQPKPLELAGFIVQPAERARADHFPILEHTEKRSAVLEIILLDIIHILELMDRFVVGNELFQGAGTAKNDKGNAINDPFGGHPFVGFNGANF